MVKTPHTTIELTAKKYKKITLIAVLLIFTGLLIVTLSSAVAQISKSAAIVVAIL
jgi:hypothetical protein|tara:strand:+ start:1638 stop:1802 length:165 start_codon:yes stop_codon:yes gene_type:complete